MEIHKGNKGFTIIEALVALAITAILLLGLLSALIMTYEYSVRNILRDEAVKIANEYAEKYRNVDFSSIPSNRTETITRKFKNKTISYTLSVTSSDVVPNKVKRVVISVNWSYKGKSYTHSIETFVRSL